MCWLSVGNNKGLGCLHAAIALLGGGSLGTMLGGPGRQPMASAFLLGLPFIILACSAAVLLGCDT